MKSQEEVNIKLWIVAILLVLQVALSGVLLFRVLKLEELVSNISTSPSAKPVFVSGVSDDGDPAIGSDNAQVTIIEFSDFECAYCADAQKSIQEIMTSYPASVRLIYRDFPIKEIHPNAINAALAAECANEQSHFWEMHDALFANQGDLSVNSLQKIAESLNLDMGKYNDCVTSEKYLSEIQQDIMDGKKYGVRGTPTFFVNGYQVNGADIKTILNVIEDELNAKSYSTGAILPLNS